MHLMFADKKNIMGMWGTLMTLALPNIVHIVAACLHCMALLCIQVNCVVGFGPFFSA